jgi:rhodanese-related sulfurtransferase
MPLKPLFLIALVACALIPGGTSAQESRVPAIGPAAIRQAVEQSLPQSKQNIDVTVWVGGPTGPASYERGLKSVMPTASAIKTFYLVELFAAHADQLDQPIPDAKQILQDDHPAISHFAPDVRDEIRRELSTATVRRVGLIMQSRTDVSNPVYNAAANLVTAHLGGPEKLTALIHARDPRFQSVMVRRYMLRDRNTPGDNEATAESFAALYQALASRRLKGISDGVMTALYDVLKRPGNSREPIFDKDGGLGTDPMTSVRAGWKETKSGPVVFVVMTRQPITDQAQSDDAYKQLQALSASLRDRVLAESQPAAKEAATSLEHTKDSLATVRANLKDQTAVLLDVRDRDEWDEGHLADAKLVPLGQLRKPNADDLLQSVPKDKIVYTHCAIGKRSLDAGRILKAKGYDVRPLLPGYDELLKDGFEKAR